MKKIVIFASGSGSNAENIILHFKNKSQGTVVAVLTNNPHAKELERAENHNVETIVFNKAELSNGTVLEKINEIQPDLIVLAGFLLMFPAAIIAQYPDKIINVHPALLPKYGGKGMYGMNVHKAVLENKDKETGISIHFSGYRKYRRLQHSGRNRPKSTCIGIQTFSGSDSKIVRKLDF